MKNVFECHFISEGIVIKRARLHRDKDKTLVEVLELRENVQGGEAWYPVHLTVHPEFHVARLEFMGLIAEITYEMANNTVDTSRENIFERGSLDRGSYDHRYRKR